MPLNIIRNDITAMAVDAIVNPTNTRMIPGGGTDAAIHKAAGPALLEACKGLGSCAPGQAKIAPGFGLPARYVIFTVGPKWYDGRSKEREILASCYRSCLELAKTVGCESVAFPLIASGSFGFPKEDALNIAAAEIRRFLEQNDMTVYLVVYDKAAFRISQKRFADIQSFIDQNYVEAHRPSREEYREFFREERREYAREEEMPLACSAPVIQPMEQEEYRPMAAPAPKASAPKASAPKAAAPFSAKRRQEKTAQSLEDFMRQMDESFTQMLLRKIDERGMTDSQCYKRANIDRKLFSKIRKDLNYHPSKTTVLAFAIALELSLAETKEMLMKAGFALSRSSKFDIIVEYYIRSGIYDIFEINEALYSFDQMTLGV